MFGHIWRKEEFQMDLDDAALREYSEMVYKFLFGLCGSKEIAEELTQETFYQAIKASSRFEGNCKVSTWLCQIAKHLWYQEIAKRKRHETTVLNENLVSDGLSIEESLCVTSEKMETFKQVHTLNGIEKEVFLLRMTGAFSFNEIGEIFDKTENWARVTFYRTKQKIVKGRIV